MIERCGDRQRKCDGLKKWPLHPLIESLPLMLQAALFLLACGLCQHMWSINTWVTSTLICFTGLGALFYLGIGIVGTSSYACPFQTPLSHALRGSWKKIRLGAKWALWHIRRSWTWLFTYLRGILPQTETLAGWAQIPNIQELDTVGHSTVTVPVPEPEDILTICTTNADDAGCVSWILRNITDPEALDAAIRLAGTIRWFDDGIDVSLSYGSIVSTFEACFDPSGDPYPGSRDMAYYSGRAIVWIHTLARCKSKELGIRFRVSGSPNQAYKDRGPDRDLANVLYINFPFCFPEQRVARLLTIDPEHTPSHMQWASDVVMRLSWATQPELDPIFMQQSIPKAHKTKIVVPLNVTLNRLLVWCIFLGSPIPEEVVKLQQKTCDTSYFAFQNTHSTLR